MRESVALLPRQRRAPDLLVVAHPAAQRAAHLLGEGALLTDPHADQRALADDQLHMQVDEAPVSVPAQGMFELPLEVGSNHRLVASGRRGGLLLKGQVDITPTLDDEGRALAIDLA